VTTVEEFLISFAVTLGVCFTFWAIMEFIQELVASHRKTKK